VPPPHCPRPAAPLLVRPSPAAPPLQKEAVALPRLVLGATLCLHPGRSTSGSGWRRHELGGEARAGECSCGEESSTGAAMKNACCVWVFCWRRVLLLQQCSEPHFTPTLLCSSLQDRGLVRAVACPPAADPRTQPSVAVSDSLAAARSHRELHTPTRRHGSRTPYCLVLRDMEPPTLLLKPHRRDADPTTTRC
jgi:hypothetical protein